MIPTAGPAMTDQPPLCHSDTRHRSWAVKTKRVYKSAWVAKSVVNQITALISLYLKFRNRNMIPTESNGTNGHSAPARPISAATRLRKRLTETNDIIVAPGVYDGFSARIALEVGFDCLYMVNQATPSERLTPLIPSP